MNWNCQAPVYISQTDAKKQIFPFSLLGKKLLLMKEPTCCSRLILSMDFWPVNTGKFHQNFHGKMVFVPFPAHVSLAWEWWSCGWKKPEEKLFQFYLKKKIDGIADVPTPRWGTIMEYPGWEGTLKDHPVQLLPQHSHPGHPWEPFPNVPGALE